MAALLRCCLSGVNLTPGQKVSAVVLHVDILATTVHVSVQPKLVSKKKMVSVAVFLLPH